MRFTMAISAPFMADEPTEFCTRLQNSTIFPQSGSLPATLVAFSMGGDGGVEVGLTRTGNAYWRLLHNTIA